MDLTQTVLVIPGSAWQVPIAQRLKEEGFRVVSVNPYEESPVFAFSDAYLKSDIFDEERVKSFCIDQNVRAIITDECDIAMPLVSKLANELGLSSLSAESAALFTDKYLMREHCHEKGFDSPEYRMCSSIDEAREFCLESGCAVVVKPLDSNSSRGVHVVQEEAALEDAFRDAQGYSRKSESVLIERFISGMEFTVDGIKAADGHRSLAVSKKRHFKHNASIASELFFSHSDDEFDYDQLRDVNDRLIESTGLEFGLTHAEYKYENGKWYLIEMAARGGGNLISSHIVPFLSEVDNYRFLIDCSVSGVRNLPLIPDESGRCAVLKFLECPTEGIVKEIKGLEEVRKTPGITEFRLNFEVGDKVGNAQNDATRIGFYIALCESEEELKSVMDAVEKIFSITVE